MWLHPIVPYFPVGYLWDPVGVGRVMEKKPIWSPARKQRPTLCRSIACLGKSAVLHVEITAVYPHMNKAT